MRKPISQMDQSDLDAALADRAPPFEEWVWDSELVVYRALPPLSKRRELAKELDGR